jgi:hypothetical protein
VSFKQVFLGVCALLVGSYSLADIWAGFISASISSLFILRVYHGSRFLVKVKLADVLIWLLGVFISMRGWSFFQELSGIDMLSNEHFKDSVLIGFATGVINTYLYVKNYDPIKKFLEKHLK